MHQKWIALQDLIVNLKKNLNFAENVFYPEKMINVITLPCEIAQLLEDIGNALSSIQNDVTVRSIDHVEI